MLKPYKHLKGYLHRWTFFESKKFHFRIHHILSEDKTPFLHNHPFSYLSIIISGGYEEVYEKNGKLIKKKNKKFSWIWRSHKTFHRITNVKPNTKTLFFTLKSPMDWTLKKHKDIAIPLDYWNASDGIYFNEKSKEYRLRKNGIWCIKKENVLCAIKQTKPSIHQFLLEKDWEKIDLEYYL